MRMNIQKMEGEDTAVEGVCFLDEKTLPAPSTLIKVNCNLSTSLWFNFLGNYYIRVTLLLNYVSITIKKSKSLSSRKL